MTTLQQMRRLWRMSEWPLLNMLLEAPYTLFGRKISDDKVSR